MSTLEINSQGEGPENLQRTAGKVESSEKSERKKSGRKRKKKRNKKKVKTQKKKLV